MAKESTLQRYQLLRRIENLLEGPMIFLGFLWLILLVVELAYGLNGALQGISSAIWIMFVVDFVLKFILAPYKWKYLTSNWLTAVSLLIPALRIFRAIRFLRLVRSIKLVKILSTLNRGMKSLNATMKKRAFGYVMLLTFIVLFAGAAGIYAFERSDS